MNRFLLVVLFVVGFALSGAAQKVIVNPDYNSANKELRLALMPYFATNAESINQIFFQSFNKGKFSISDTAGIMQNILNHEVFNNSLRKTISLNYDKKLLKKGFNLYTSLNDKEIADFQANFLEADILIVGSQLETEKVTKVNGSGNIELTGGIAAFDLRSGDFILQCSDKVKSKHSKIDPATPIPLKELMDSLYTCFEKNLK